jgi:hypothetical protein
VETAKNGRLTALCDVRTQQSVSAANVLRFDFGTGFISANCLNGVHVGAYKDGVGSLYNVVIIELPAIGVGTNPFDLSIGRYWVGPAAAVEAPLGADWEVSADSVEAHGESRGFQVYSQGPAPSRDRLNLSLVRVTQAEMYTGPGDGYSLRDFMRVANGQEVLVGRGTDKAGDGIFYASSANAEPRALFKGRLGPGSRRSRQAGPLMQAQLTIIEEM